MKVLRLTAEGSSTAIPEWFPEEKRYAFFHGKAPTGSAGKVSSYAYALRMSKKSFPAGESYNWQRMEYDLTLAHPRQSDELGNPIYVVRRSFTSGGDGNCLCLLNMCHGQMDNSAILFSWNEMVTFLGKGIEECAKQFRRGGARRALEIEQPVLLCRPGAKFEWAVNGLFSGVHSDFQAEWDGTNFHFIHQPLAVTNLMEQFHLANQSEQRRALRRED